MRTIDPPTAWRELIAVLAADNTLRAPDMLSTPERVTVGDERLACSLVHRLAPPRGPFADRQPERVLVGHGEGVTEDAAAALVSSLDTARPRLPRALVSQAPTQIRPIVSAIRD